MPTFNDFRQLLSKVYDSTNKALRVNVVLGGGGGGGGGSGVNYGTAADDFTATGTGTQVIAATAPCKSFGLQVKKTGSITSWTIVLEASLDGINFATVLTHSNTSPGDGKIMWTGTQDSPALYFQARCTQLTLGTGTKVTATVLGMS